MSWRDIAEKKRASLLADIVPHWHISTPSNEPKDVTGSYIQQYLTARETEVTEAVTIDIVKKLSNGSWSAREVTEAFCHRAAVAHQLVRFLHNHLHMNNSGIPCLVVDDLLCQIDCQL